jgi:hypothetical protein
MITTTALRVQRDRHPTDPESSALPGVPELQSFRGVVPGRLSEAITRSDQHTHPSHLTAQERHIPISALAIECAQIDDQHAPFGPAWSGILWRGTWAEPGWSVGSVERDSAW